MAVWLFCTFFVVNLLWTGTAAAVFRFLPWLLLAAWAVYVLLWRPRIVLHPASLDVVNLLRTHTVPFEALIAFRVTQVVSFDTTAGRIASWGAPAAGKLGPRTERTAPHGTRTRTGTARTAPSVPETQSRVEQALLRWEAGQAAAGSATPAEPKGASAVTVRWDIAAIGVGVVLVLWTATAVLAG